MNCTGAAGAVYGLGFLGAAVYFISNSSGVVGWFVGLFKAIIWPAFTVFEILQYIGA